MKISQLEVFQAVAENEHISKTATQLHIAQPAVSKTLHELEKELDVSLFDHVGRGIKLNENGRIVLKYTKRILNDLDNIKREIQESNEKGNYEVTLSAQVATQMIPELISSFRRKYPHFKISFTQENNADLVLFASTVPLISDHCMMLFKENLVLAVPIDHALAKREHVSLLEFKDDDFISYTKTFSKSKSLGELTSEYCKAVGFSPKIVLESDNPLIVRQLVEQGLGVSLIPEYTWQHISHEKIKLLAVSEPTCIRYFHLTWDSNRYLGKAQQLFKEHLIDFFKH